MNVAKEAAAIVDKLVAWRRHLHAHPEVSFAEAETAAFIAEELSAIKNLDVVTQVGGTNGIVATLSSGSGPVIALRADMDALPIEEENTHGFVSKNKGVMHACGHDAHTAILLGTIHLLAKQFQEGTITGTVKFIFQPAEESTDRYGLTGAPYMMRAGVLHDADIIIALHVCPWQPIGAVQMNDGYSMANVDVFEATIQGTGGHGGYPHVATDPLWILGNVLQTFYATVGRRISPLDTVAASIGRIEAGTASNIIPNEVKIEGTLRSYAPDVREKLAFEAENAFKLAEQFGGGYTFYREKGEPALNNDQRVNQLLKKAMITAYPEINIEWAPFGMGGEDFGHMTEAIPGAMFFLGCALEDGIGRDLHTAIFDIDERCLPIGAAILTETVHQFFLSGKNIETSENAIG